MEVKLLIWKRNSKLAIIANQTNGEWTIEEKEKVIIWNSAYQ